MNTKFTGTLPQVDVLILLAATAAGVAGTWYCLGTKIIHVVEFANGNREVSAAGFTTDPNVGTVAAAVGVLLAAWSLALVVVAWRRRKSGLEASTRSPGLAACSTACLLSAVYLGIHLLKAAFLGWPVELFSGNGNGWVWITDQIDGFAFLILPGMTRAVAPVALGALLFSVVTARRRPRGWVEWAGVAVGLGWVVVGLLIAWWPPSGWDLFR